jgi:hypothetical protein
MGVPPLCFAIKLFSSGKAGGNIIPLLGLPAAPVVLRMETALDDSSLPNVLPDPKGRPASVLVFEEIRCKGTGSGRRGLEPKIGVGERKSLPRLDNGEAGLSFPLLGVGEANRFDEGESLPPDKDIDELNDRSTSIGKSTSVRVGERAGDEKRDEGKDSTRGDEENESMLMKLWLCRAVSRGPDAVRRYSSMV